jgi:hypothetical protein
MATRTKRATIKKPEDEKPEDKRPGAGVKKSKSPGVKKSSGVKKSPGVGSPFATELDIRLKSSEPLSSIIAWWNQKYIEWCPVLDAKGIKGIGPISDREMTVFCVCGPENSLDPEVQISWDSLREDRAALQATV